MVRTWKTFALVAFAAGTTAWGCSLFREYPDDFCETNQDCFRAQGEICNLSTNHCEIAPDAGPTPDAGPDAAPVPDAGSQQDAEGTDADPSDAGTLDADPGVDA